MLATVLCRDRRQSTLLKIKKVQSNSLKYSGWGKTRSNIFLSVSCVLEFETFRTEKKVISNSSFSTVFKNDKKFEKKFYFGPVDGNRRVYDRERSNEDELSLDGLLMANHNSTMHSNNHIVTRCYKDYHNVQIREKIRAKMTPMHLHCVTTCSGESKVRPKFWDELMSHPCKWA